jgi:RNase H-like domain found in reverse transcriptase/Integrase zinc binding domain
LGAVFTELQSNGDERVMQYASRALSKVEQRYSNTERELLAIVWAVTKKFCFYVEYRSVKVFTDHKALIGRTRLTEESKRLVRMWMKLQKFNVHIEHKAGADMTSAEALSQFVARAAPVEDRKILIRQRHEELGHRSQKTTYESLKTTGPWLGMRKLIWETIIKFPICNKYNILTKCVGSKICPIETSRPNELIWQEIWGKVTLTPDRYGYCCVAIDHFS